MRRDTVQHKEEIRGYFDARMSDYDAFYEPPSMAHRLFNRVFRRAVYQRRDRVVTLAQRFGLESVLDVGCGSGRNTIWWAHKGIERLHGIDISSEMIQEARLVAEQSGIGERCSFELADFMDWDTDRRYEMTVACGVFDYVVDAEAFLSHMARFSTRVIYGSFPGWTLVRAPLRKLRYTLRGCPTHFYFKGEIERIFNRVGFGTTEIESIDGGYLAWSYR